MIWYDSGVVNAEELYAEKMARKEHDAWPFGKEPMPVATLEEIRKRFNPAERVPPNDPS
jgi:hypothetical protein